MLYTPQNTQNNLQQRDKNRNKKSSYSRRVDLAPEACGDGVSSDRKSVESAAASFLLHDQNRPEDLEKVDADTYGVGGDAAPSLLDRLPV